MTIRIVTKLCCLMLFLFVAGQRASAQPLQSELFAKQTFTQSDAVFISDNQGNTLFEWRAEEPMVPASLVKLLTSYLAIDKWGLDHQFKTEFYRLDDQLWVKGYGDPYLTSEEIDVIAVQLQGFDLRSVESLHIDSHYFVSGSVPGGSGVTDPYNAPMSAVAANFNTVSLKRDKGLLISAEAQTPITQTAEKLSTSIQALASSVMQSKAVRINLKSSSNAQRHFAELLIAKLGMDVGNITIDQRLPVQAELIYRHDNSNVLRDVLSGALLYSNNFIANQVFLKLAELNADESLGFELAESRVRKLLNQQFEWTGASIVEGAGLSRDNRLSAKQVDDVLQKIRSNQQLLKYYDLESAAGQKAFAYAKTGTLNGVSNYAGYLYLGGQEYRFVFMFNRQMPYGYRERLLKILTIDLAQIQNKGQ